MDSRVIPSIAELRQVLSEVRGKGRTIGFVPTMGALHAGHARLIASSVDETDCTVVSIFVNPIQFNDAGDYKRYPRDMQADLALCRERGVQFVFAPPLEEMYPQPQRTFVEVAGVAEYLCGKFRPGHFRGVATVVLKLFEIVQPDRAYFGEKDAQQLRVIECMVRDLNVPVEVVEVPTVREPDGLALSSRNQLLSAEERRVAPALYQALQLAESRIASGVRDAVEIRRVAAEKLGQPGIRVEYFEIVDPESMQPVERVEGPVRVLGAIWLGSTRLIDNILCRTTA